MASWLFVSGRLALALPLLVLLLHWSVVPTKYFPW